MIKKHDRAVMGVAMAAFAAMMAVSTAADASYRARSITGGFDDVMAWFESLLSEGETSDSGVRMDPNG